MGESSSITESSTDGFHLGLVRFLRQHFRVVETVACEVELIDIEDDDEFEAVSDAFDELLDEQEFDEMLGDDEEDE